MSSTLHSAAAAPAALSAFLRGVERRAAVFAELQCGGSVTADMALAAAMRAFRSHASTVPMSEWPQRFWTLLAATPGLRQACAEADWPAGLEALALIEPAHRRGLLLRLAAGLEEASAAAAAGLDAEGYRAALAAACPRDAQGEPDPIAWRALAEAIQQQVRSLPPERLARVARLREAAIEGPRPAPAAAQDLPPRLPPPRALTPPQHRSWRNPAIAAALLAVAVAIAATWYWPMGGRGADATAPWADPAVVVEALPESEPAARFNDAQALLLHPDLELILDPEEPALVKQADFLAWYLAATEASPEAIAEPDDTVEAADPQGWTDAPR